MAWNYQSYEYDVLLMTQGRQIFLHDYGPDDLTNDISKCDELIADLEEDQEARKDIILEMKNDLIQKYGEFLLLLEIIFF